MEWRLVSMGAGASVPAASVAVLDEALARRLAGSAWDQAHFDATAKVHDVVGPNGSGKVRGVLREEFITLVANKLADTQLGNSNRRPGEFWDRVNRLYLFMDAALGTADGVVTLPELKVRRFGARGVREIEIGGPQANSTPQLK